MRQTVLEGVCPMMTRLLGSENERATGKSKAPRATEQGLALKLAAPEEEERAIFQDKSDPPMNLLIECLKNLEVNPASQEQLIVPPSKNVNGCAGATKDDKAPINSEWWGEMLNLGSSDHTRAGLWVKASQLI